MTLRTQIKAVLERGAVAWGGAMVARRRRCNDTLVLAYHNIVPDGAPVRGDRSLHLPQRAFARQLDQLRKTHEIVPLATLLTELAEPLSAARERPSHRPRAVITFDDAYRGAVTAGVAELRTRGLPATIFVPPGYVVRGGDAFWWDLLTPTGADELPAPIRAHALEAESGKQDQVLRWTTGRGDGVTPLPPHAHCATVDELSEALRQHQELTFGAHTCSHPNLTRLAPYELSRELTESRQWLEERFPERTVATVTYPYGCATPAVWDAARAAGYAAGFMIDGGWIGSTTPGNRYALPRLNIPAGVSLDGFVLRAAGVLTR